MAAVTRTRISSSVVSVFVGGLAGALLLGGVVGYLVRTVGSPASAPVQAVDHQPVRTAELPSWVGNYGAPAKQSSFKVDEMIESLSYVRPAELPAWVQSYQTRTEEPQFKVDAMIEDLSYARPAELPDWVQRYQTPAEEPQFKADQLIESLS